MRRRPLLLLCLVVLAGCGGGTTDVTVPDGFTVRTVKEPSLSIALPVAWRSFANRRADAPVKLVGALADPGGKLVTNMNVVQTRVPSSLSFDQMKRTEARQLKLAAGAKNVQQAEAELPAGRALRLSYGTRSNAFVRQYFVRRDDLLYVLTYTTRSGNAARFAGIFDQSARTFQVR